MLLFASSTGLEKLVLRELTGAGVDAVLFVDFVVGTRTALLQSQTMSLNSPRKYSACPLTQNLWMILRDAHGGYENMGLVAI